jgi:hypothetical protein
MPFKRRNSRFPPNTSCRDPRRAIDQGFGSTDAALDERANASFWVESSGSQDAGRLQHWREWHRSGP